MEDLPNLLKRNVLNAFHFMIKRLFFFLWAAPLLAMEFHLFYEEGFYQNPDETEYQAYLSLKKNPLGEHFHYVAVPWEYVIKNNLPFPDLKLKGGCTVCQYPDYETLIPALKKIGIDTLFTPYAKKDQNLGITILPFPSFPKNKEKSSLKVKVCTLPEIYNALKSGIVPVISADIPLPRPIDWDRCLVRVHHKNDLAKAASLLTPKEIDRMRAYGEEIYYRYLTEDTFANLIRDAYATPAPSSAFTYKTFPPGQLGDRLLQYVKTKWLAYKYDLPFIYQPFQRAEELLLNELEDHSPFQFKKTQTLVSEHTIDASGKILYEVDLSFKDEEWGNPSEVGTWKTLLNDLRFRTNLRKGLMPKTPCSQLVLPKDALTIAVHIRKGTLEEPPLYSEQLFTSYDKEAPPPNPDLLYADIKWPLKFPPSQYYIEEIKNLSYNFDHPSIYIQLFTDAENPQSLLQEIKEGVDLPNIRYGIREKGTWHEHILDDLFAMTQFDCLIRSGSNYSQIAHLIGDFTKVIFPKRSFWAGKKLIVLAH